MEGPTAFLYVIPSQRYAFALLANRERYVPELYPVVFEAARIVLEHGPH